MQFGTVYHSLGSMGGNDIIAIVLHQRYNFRIGTYFLLFNLGLFAFSLGSLSVDRERIAMKPACKTLVFVLVPVCCLIFLALTGCRVTGGSAGIEWGDPDPNAEHPGDPAYGPSSGKGPPAHAPAHGYRRKYQYRYYPEAEVYRDAGRDLYFYYEDGRWTASVSLPPSIRLQLGDSVRVEMYTDKPYQEHDAVKKKYPPGQVKKKGRGKKGKGLKWE